MAKQPVSPELFNRILDNPRVRQALRDKAARMLPRAKALAYQQGAVNFGDALEMQQGTRPGSGSPSGIARPYARITAELTPEVEQDPRTPLTRRKILRRSSSA